MAENTLQGKRIAFLVAPEGTEQVELTEPWKAVEQAGGTPELVSTDSGEIQALNHLDKGDTFPVDRTVSDADASDYDGLVLPGGVANPDILRTDAGAVGFVRDFFAQAKPVGVICHGPTSRRSARRWSRSWPRARTSSRRAASAPAAAREAGHSVVLASSAKPDEVDPHLDLLDARSLIAGWTTAGDVERTKPEPDLVAAAVEKAGGGPAVMVGDSTWDCESAKRAGLPTIGVLMGGFSEQELLDAGATAVFGSLGELRERRSETPFGQHTSVQTGCHPFSRAPLPIVFL